jgi:Glycosyl transferase family 2
MSLPIPDRELAGRVMIPEIHADPRHALEEFWPAIREDRRRRRADRDPGRRHALITMVHNEPLFLPIWLAYYSRFFSPEDIYVFDNDSTDGSVDRDGFVRIPVSHDRVDHTWMVRTIEELQHELFDRYDVVLVTDVDEIITPTPEWGGLDEYIDRFEDDYVKCVGYEILHLIDREAAYDPGQPILDQRGYWFPNSAYDKPALTSASMRWEPGFHKLEGEDYLDGSHWDPDLRLVHLHRMDFDLCRERHGVRRERAWNGLDLDEGWASYNRTTEEGEFERWFYEDSGFEDEGIHIVLERIPEDWRGLF